MLSLIDSVCPSIIRRYLQPRAKGQLFMKYLNEFLEYKSLKSKKTVEFYATGLRQFFAFCGNQWPPTSENIQGFLRHSQEKGLKRSTVYDYFRCVRGFCNWLHKTGRIATNPVDFIDRPPRPTQQIPRAPVRASVDKLFEYLEQRVNAAMVLGRQKGQYRDVRDMALFSLMFGTGMRIGEIERLEWSDIDFDKRVIDVRITKTGKPRRVQFTEIVRGDLKLWKSLREELQTPDIDHRIFVSHYRRKWRKMTHWGIRRALEKRLVQAGVSENFTPHQLRHAYASQKIANGASVEDVRQDLGHNSLSMTTIYAMMAPEDREERHDRFAPR